jgi:Pyruvate/2-oxoacid:ferredoxin oxidoreductase gamma subunit
VTLKSLEAAVLARVPPGTAEMNQKALAAGVQAAARLLREEPQANPSYEEEGM